MTQRPSFNTGFHIDRPSTIPTLTFSTSGGSMASGTYGYAISFVTSIGETNISDIVSDSATGPTASCALSAIPTSGNIQVTARKIYRTTSGGAASTLKYLTILQDNFTTTYTDTANDSALGTAVPVVLSTSDQTIGSYGTVYNNGLQSRAVTSATSATVAATTCHGSFISLTFTTVNVGAVNSTPAVITNNCVSASSKVTAHIQSFGGALPDKGLPSVIVSNIVDGAFTLNITNTHPANALEGPYVIYCTVIN